MKVILKADVKGSGKKGDIIEVSDGYAKNFLLKKNLAEVATASSVNEINQQKQAQAFHKAEEVKAAQALAAELKGKKVALTIKTGEKGKLFGSITSAQISEALAEAGYSVDKKKILLKEPIKTLGSYNVDIRLMEKVDTQIVVEVKPLS
ncbi:MAG: 50S ribosomal protein L9 [Clostridia bacterium]|nr:50S ribosomal protein L9 [Clostridia bacterium]